MKDRFLAKISPEPNSGCWLWTASVDGCGYGLFGIGGSGNIRRAHIVSYEMHKGPVPPGLKVLHKCDMPGCVNPDHLFTGTHADNCADKVAKGRHAFGVRNGKAKLSDDIARWIKESGLSERQIAATVGLHRSTINAVRSGRTWRHA